ncbi:MAG: MarR family winged helix-turn-helix transcriptional regulator, partial [Candidatus Saccharibacteria bacterium]
MNDRKYIIIKDGRSTIKQPQIDILEVLYKYRFGSRKLIANLLKINEATLYKKLIVLIKHGLIGSKLDNKSKIKGIPVAYYLTPKGLKYLQSLENHKDISEKIIKASYRDKSASESVIVNSFTVMSQIIALGQCYPQLKAYLRRDMSQYSYFPKTLPDAFLSLQTENVTKRFFFDYIPDSQERKIFFQRIYSY